MAKFVLYKTPDSAGASDRHARIVNPNTEEVWDRANGAMAANPTYADTAIQLTHDIVLNGYIVTIPANLPVGDYDLLVYDVAFGSAANVDAVEVGYAFKWNGDNMISSRRQFLTNLVK